MSSYENSLVDGMYVPPPYDVNTPVSMARAIINRLEWEVDEVVLEPCRGTGAFYNNLPGYVRKHWCEITEGRDFFDWTWPVDTVITNPPFNGIFPFFQHALTVATKRVVFLVSHNGMRFFDLIKLSKWEKQGWGMTQLRLMHTKKWREMMFLWVFEKGYEGGTHLFWDKKRYEA